MYQCSLAVGTYKEELVHNLEVGTVKFREVPFDSSNDGGAGDHLARAGDEEHQLAVCKERGSHRRQPRVQSSCSYGHYNNSLHSVNTVLLYDD